MEPLPFSIPRPEPSPTTTIILEDGQNPPTIVSPCDICLASGQPHTVHRGVTTVETRANPTTFDGSGASHIHNNRQDIHGMRCSNGHKWAERFIYKCPSCEWTVDHQEMLAT